MTINHTFTVTDPIGLHARPVGQIVTLVRESGATVTLPTAKARKRLLPPLSKCSR